MEALIYGMIPRAKIAALLNAPPTNRSKRPNRVSEAWFFVTSAISTASTPGSVTWEPSRTTIRSAAVNRILVLSSWILKMFRKLSLSFAISPLPSQ